MSDDKELLSRFHNPSQELTEHGEWRIGDDDVSLVAEGADFGAAEVTVALQILPFEVFDVDVSALIGVASEDEYLAVGLAFVNVVVCPLLRSRNSDSRS